jgi:plasmid stabilization system protein ParE
MTARVRLHPGAADDVREAIAWHDSKASGLGRIVPMELRRVIERVRLFPEAYPQIKPGVRQATITRLPYHAIYITMGDQIIIIAVMHIRRDPQALEQTIMERNQS